MTETLRVGTRASRLAMAQAGLAADALRALGHAVALVPLSTPGDRDRRRTFAELGRGSFAAEIEEALIDGRIDVAVHSAKDMTGDERDDLAVAAYLPRADARDAWCGEATSLERVPQGARVGTSSLRRRAQLLALRPDLVIEPLRGNVDTRLRKRTERGLDGIMLACAGLDRLDLGAEAGFRFDPAVLVPEAAQGVIALQTRTADAARLASADDAPTRAAVDAERACTRALGGGCTVPVAAHAVAEAGGWRLTGWIGSPDGAATLVESASGVEPVALGLAVAEALLARGGAGLIAGARA